MIAAHLQDLAPLYSVDAEMCVLGSMLLSERACEEVLQIITADDFYNPAHRIIFAAMKVMLTRSTALDIITLKNELMVKDQFENAGGDDYLFQVAEAVPSPLNAEYYAGIVKDRSIYRAVEKVARQYIHLVHHGEFESATGLLDKAAELLFEIEKKRGGKTFSIVRDLAKDLVVNLDNAIEGGVAASPGIATGFADVDAITKGFHRGELTILGARPAMGKTSLALAFTLAAAKAQKGNVAVFSLEMPERQIMERYAAMIAGVSTDETKNPHITPSVYGKLMDACERVYSLPIHIDDTSSINSLEIRGKCRRLQADGGLALVVVDYLQLMNGIRKTENRVQEVGDIARGLKALAKELDVPVVALSQLSRAVESRDDKRPVLSDLRDSGGIEAEADVVMFLYRDAYYKPRTNSTKGDAIDYVPVDEAELIIRKHRNGPTGTAFLGFHTASTKFSSLRRGI